MSSRRRDGRSQRRRGEQATRRSPGRKQSRPAWEALLERNRGGIITGVIIFAVVVLAGLGTWAATRAASEAADFELQLYQGEEVLGASNLNFADLLDQGKPVVLNFWGGSCPPCRFEMPDFQWTYDAHRGDITMVGLDVGVHFGLGTRLTALALLDELDITYPAGAPVDDSPVRGFGVTGLPTTVFFDSQGKAVRVWEGVITIRQMESIISDLR